MDSFSPQAPQPTPLENPEKPALEQPPQAPPSPTISSPTVEAGFTGTKAAAGIGKKILGLVISIAAVASFVTAGYFFFPEQFYNTIGKYVGMETPAAIRVVSPEPPPFFHQPEEEGIKEPKRMTAAELSLLEETLPGADASVVIHLIFTPELKKALDLIETREAMDAEAPQAERKPADRSPSVLDDLRTIMDAFQGIEEIIVAGKFSPKLFLSEMADFREEEIAAVAIIRLMPGKTAEFETLIAQMKEEEPDFPFAIDSKGGGVFVATNPSAKEPLTGKLSENELLAAVKATEANFAVAIDIQEFVRRWLEENAPPQNAIQDPFIAQSFALAQKARNFTLFVSLTQGTGETFDMSISAQFGMEDVSSAEEILSTGQASLAQFNPLLLLPPDLQPLISFDLQGEGKFVRLKIILKDIETIAKKLEEMFMASSTLPFGPPEAAPDGYPVEPLLEGISDDSQKPLEKIDDDGVRKKVKRIAPT